MRTTIIEAGGINRDRWRDLWQARELFAVLAWRDVSVRYKQTVVGVAWAFVRPFVTMVIFTVVFGRLANLQADGSVPYALIVLCGVLPWMFFSTALSDAANSIVDNAGLIGKVYFPRMVIPAAVVLVALIDLLVGFGILIAMLLWFRFLPDWHVVFAPLFILWATLAVFGPGLWLASLNAKYRDFRYIVPFAVQLGLFLSPVGFSSSVVPEQWRLLYALNPMVGIIDGFRWSILAGQTTLHWPSLLIGMAVTVALLWLGIRRFRAMERSFADVL